MQLGWFVDSLFCNSSLTKAHEPTELHPIEGIIDRPPVKNDFFGEPVWGMGSFHDVNDFALAHMPPFIRVVVR